MVLGFALLAAPSDAESTAPLDSQLGPTDRHILNVHNRERAAFGAQPLQWDMKLARDATTHAEELARMGRLAHASRQGRGIVRENVNQVVRGSSPDQLMANWLREKALFRPGLFPNVSVTGNWYDVGHYSQMIWPTTLFIGCGLAKGPRWDFFVCRYSPGGNKDGKAVGHVTSLSQPRPRGPGDSATSRQRLGTPSQARKTTNLEVLCRPPPKQGSPTNLESDGAGRPDIGRWDQLVAELKRLKAALEALKAGLADHDPNLIEELLGNSEAPEVEKIKAIAARMKEVMDELAAMQRRIEEELARLQRPDQRLSFDRIWAPRVADICRSRDYYRQWISIE
jgi:hypothetical protein